MGSDDPATRPDAFIRGYAWRRMRERGISEAAVLHVLQHYTVSRPAPSRRGSLPTDILIGEYQGRMLKVYVVRGSNPPRGKTAVWEGDDQGAPP